MHRIMAVLELPPSDVLRILVRGELRNGIWSLEPSAFIAITCVKKNKLLLICYPSLILMVYVDTWLYLSAPFEDEFLFVVP